MENEKKISLYKTDDEISRLREFAYISVKSDTRLLYYRIFFGFVSLLFLAFSIYSLVFLLNSGAAFQFGMLIYIIVPLIGAGIPFAFIKLKRKELAEMICEEQSTEIIFFADRITVQGISKRKLVRKNDGSSVFESRASLFSEGDGKPMPFRYDIRLSELRYFAYSADHSKLKFILGTESYPDINLIENEAYKEICAELESRGIKKTAYIK